MIYKTKHMNAKTQINDLAYIVTISQIVLLATYCSYITSYITDDSYFFTKITLFVVL